MPAALYRSLSLVILLCLQPAVARDYVTAVGSSTLYPFATVVAERIGKSTRLHTPLVEALGSGGGIRQFCAGVGVRYADIALASRQMRLTEWQRCRANGVADITELRLGHDGIVLASGKSNPLTGLTLKELYLALGKQVPDPTAEGKLIANPHSRWQQINPALPDLPIRVYGPPPTSGTRDVFVERALQSGCLSIPWISGLRRTQPDRVKALCQSMREDGIFIETGEDDNLTILKVKGQSDALGILGFNYFDSNRDSLKALELNGVLPDYDTILSGGYPLGRPLFAYVKSAHVSWIPGMREFLQELTSEQAAGQYGYLLERGLVALPEAERRQNAAIVKKLSQ